MHNKIKISVIITNYNYKKYKPSKNSSEYNRLFYDVYLYIQESYRKTIKRIKEIQNE